MHFILADRRICRKLAKCDTANCARRFSVGRLHQSTAVPHCEQRSTGRHGQPFRLEYRQMTPISLTRIREPPGALGPDLFLI
jgi:hypothetical protein